ncbi:MAG: ACP S-malonyltransferase [Pseudanabaenaceae cyanobacterium bins.68]|nr:ACP S-malonyltransferase [Pseudanabaenaceae cyanobacterium bins.68]
MNKIWVFPGQGSQSVGMADDLLAVGQEKFRLAEQILGWSITEKCRATAEELAQTQFTQPSLYTISVILTDLLKQAGEKPDLVAGHSLGEYSALYCAGVFDFATGLKLVQQRSQLMAATQGGAMTALIGFDRSELEAAIATIPDVVLANDNSAEQVVISGTAAAVAELVSQVKTKRAIPLPVSGAFHSPLMAEAANAFTQVLNSVEFADPQIPVLLNLYPDRPLEQASQIQAAIAQQITAPVRWREICIYLEQQYPQARVLEVGAGKVLTGLIKRTAPSLELFNLSSLSQVQAYLS